MMALLLLLLLLLLMGSPTCRALTGLAIPGTTQTISGYDTELGEDAMCWRSRGAPPRRSNRKLDSMNHMATATANMSSSMHGNTNDSHGDDASSMSAHDDASSMPHGDDDTMHSSKMDGHSSGSHAMNHPDGHISFPNALVSDFFLNDKVELLRECPTGNVLTAESPVEFQRGERPRTGEWYNYTVSASLNVSSLVVDSLSQLEFISDEGHTISVQIYLCELGKGFCSPFVHDVSNHRLHASENSTSVEYGDRHGSTHVHSPATILTLLPEDGPVYNVTTQVPMRINAVGDFFVIASVQMFVTDFWGVKIRYDMANALIGSQRLLTYQEPAEIMEVPPSILIVSYVAIGLSALAIGFMLVQTIQYRQHQILQLTQGPFLILFLGACLGGTVASFLFEPRNDSFCRSSFSVTLICGQIIYAVTLGRVWRINTLVSPLLKQTLRQQQQQDGQSIWKGCGQAVDRWLKRMVPLYRWLGGSAVDSRSIRQRVDERKLTILIGIITLPQVVLQVLVLVFQAPERDIYYDLEETVGRAHCSNGASTVGGSLLFYGQLYFALTVAVLLYVAHQTRSLPSLFNETRDIFDATLVALIIVALGTGIIVISDSPTTTPGIEYMVEVAIMLSIALNTSVRIMLPKLRMIWRGEVVLVSKLVADHKQSVEQDDMNFKRQSFASYRTASFSMTKNSIRKFDSNVGRFTEPSQQFGSSRNNDSSGPSDSSEATVPAGSSSAPSPAPSPPTRQPQRNQQSKKLPVDNKETPPRRLVIKLLNTKNQLTQVTDNIMTGKVVSEEDWESLRRLSVQLGYVFENEVEFAWTDGSSPRSVEDDIAQLAQRAQANRRGGRRRPRMEEPIPESKPNNNVV